MIFFTDIHERQIRLSEERKKHIEENHPEMQIQMEKIVETLNNPQIIKESSTDTSVELFYRFYTGTSVGDIYLYCSQSFRRRFIYHHSIFYRQDKTR